MDDYFFNEIKSHPNLKGNNLEDAESAGSAGQAGTQWSGHHEISARNNLA